MVILPTVSNLEQTHIRQIYNSTQIRSTPYIAPRNLVTKAHPTSISSTHSTHPTYVTTNPHSKSNHLSLYLAHLSFRSVQPQCRLQLYTYRHTCTLTKTAQFNSHCSNVLIISPHHNHPYLIWTHTSLKGTTYITLCYMTTPLFIAIDQPKYHIATPLSHTDITVILHPVTTTQYQVLLLIPATHLLLMI